MTQAAFHWSGSDYAAQSSAQQSWAEQLLQKLALVGDEFVLDLGCGDGKISASIAASLHRGKVLAIDASKDMIAFAQQKYAGISNLVFKHENAMTFSCEEKVDVVFSNAVLHWLNDHRRVLQNCHQSLRQGGKVLLQMGGKGNAKTLISVVTEVTSKPEWQDYFSDFEFPYHFYAVEDYQSWLNETGFQATRIELIDKDMQHQGKEGLKGWFRTTWMPYTFQLPVQLRESFINDVVENYLERFPIDECGYTHVAMKRLEVEAIKN